MQTIQPTDARAVSTDKIEPYDVFPYISRKALRIVGNHLSIPETCPCCGGDVEVKTHGQIYGRDYSDWPYIYVCAEGCDVRVGMHPNTDLPLGSLADAELRRARKSCKGPFIALSKRVGRNEAYAWLAEALGIDVDHCHFGWFDVEQCIYAGALCHDRMKQLITEA